MYFSTRVCTCLYVVLDPTLPTDMTYPHLASDIQFHEVCIQLVMCVCELCTCVRTYVCMCAYVYICGGVLCVYVSTYVCRCAYVYICGEFT